MPKDGQLFLSREWENVLFQMRCNTTLPLAMLSPFMFQESCYETGIYAASLSSIVLVLSKLKVSSKVNWSVTFITSTISSAKTVGFTLPALPGYV
jgi:hypothetical protein